ncbi:MAG: hypothetical protein DRQ40_03910 [Gammaproteobacteria bacterium]|nr:MAG: hypothetical protein DRQ40_03910 [Gammaproteobacteria bacterium]
MIKSYEQLIAKPISRADAKKMVIRNHYMKTFPSGAKLYIGIFDKDTERAVGVCVMGYSTATEKKVQKLCFGLSKGEIIEMQRLWISDDYGHNSESYVLAKIMKLIKQKTRLKVVFTHAGGCKNDCGIVYQASSWLYFGREKCNDFYLTAAGEYKNIIAPMRFGRVNSKGKTPQQVGEELFGAGKMVDSWRYSYIYPLDKGIRRRLAKLAEEYPKDSQTFRRDQEWVV